MRYDVAIRLKRYLLDNYGSDCTSVRVHSLYTSEIIEYRERGVKCYSTACIRILANDGVVAEWCDVTKQSVKAMRSFMLDYKYGLN